MAGRKGARPTVITQVQVSAVEDAATQRALDALTSAVQDLQANRAAAGGEVTGSRAGGSALVSLLAVLAAQGIIVDSTEA